MYLLNQWLLCSLGTWSRFIEFSQESVVHIIDKPDRRLSCLCCSSGLGDQSVRLVVLGLQCVHSLVQHAIVFISKVWQWISVFLRACSIWWSIALCFSSCLSNSLTVPATAELVGIIERSIASTISDQDLANPGCTCRKRVTLAIWLLTTGLFTISWKEYSVRDWPYKLRCCA